MTISLHPKELGDVAIHLHRGPDGSTAVTITASRSETLRSLSQNVAHLHAALDAADVPTLNRVLTFAAPTAQQLTHATHMPNPSDQSGGAPPGQADFAFGEAPERREPRGQTVARDTTTPQTAGPDEGVAASSTINRLSPSAGQRRTQINITA